MNNWGTSREVEKPKNLTAKRAAARDAAERMVERLAKTEGDIQTVLGYNCPLLSEIRAASTLITRLVVLLPGVLKD